MRIAIDRRRMAWVGVVMLLWLVMPVAASAQGTPAGQAGAVQDVVEAVDVGAGTIVLGAETFGVSTRSRLLDAGGRPIGLSALNATGSGGDGDVVEFIATSKRSGGLRVIRTLQVVEGDFE